MDTLTDNLTIKEAFKAMKAGFKIRHKYFTSDEYYVITAGGIRDEHGCKTNIEEKRTDSKFQTGWSIVQDGECPDCGRTEDHCIC